MNTSNSQTQNGARGSAQPRRSMASACFDLFTSMRFGIAIMFILMLACIIGTLLPQGPEVNDYLRAHPDAATRMKWLHTFGFTHIFYSWWFLGLLAVLGANLSVCVFRRLRTLPTLAGRERIKIIGTILVHVSLLVIFAGGLIRGFHSEKGYIEFREGEIADSFMTPDQKAVPLPFKVQLKDFAIEHYESASNKNPFVEQLHVEWSERGIRSVLPVEAGTEKVVVPEGETSGSDRALHVSVVRKVSDFVIDMTTKEVTSRSDSFENPAILVKVTGKDCDMEQWLFARYPDFNVASKGGHGTASNPPVLMSYQVMVQSQPQARIKSFKSTLQILQGDALVKEETIEVNTPLYYRGYGIFQSGYNEKDPSWTSLQVVHDPSVPVIYTGFIMIMVGLIIVINSRNGIAGNATHGKGAAS